METVTNIPPFMIPVGTQQRIVGLTAVKTIKLVAGEDGVYIQTISQNVRMTLDGSTPTPTGNDLGFQITPAMGPIFVRGFPGMTLSFIQEAATATVQYLKIRLQGRPGV